MTALREVQRAFTRVCFDETPSEADLALLHADRERWLLYRRMVRRRLAQMVRSGLPKTAELLGKGTLDAAIARYLAERGPRTRFLREVVHELVEHALPDWEADRSLPAHLCELVRYEDAKWRVASLPEPAPAQEFDFEAVPIFSDCCRTVLLHYRVDKDAIAPERLVEPRQAIVYRRPGETLIHTLVLPVGAERLWAAWQRGLSGAEGARAVLAELGREPDAAFVDLLAGVLADLIEKKLILGSRR